MDALLTHSNMVRRLGVAETRLLPNVDAHSGWWFRNVHVRVVLDDMLLETSGNPQWYVRGAR